MSGTGEFLTAERAATLASVGRGDLKPRLQVFVGPGVRGKVGAIPTTMLTFPISANILRSNFFAADRFKIEAALFADQNQSYEFWAPPSADSADGSDNFTPDSFNNGMNVMVKIQFLGLPPPEGADADGWYTVFRGFVDRLDIDCHKGIVTLTGRNFMGLLIDAMSVVNQTDPMATVITNIAKTHDLAINFGPDGSGNMATEVFGTEIQGEVANATTMAQSQEINQGDSVSHICQYEGRMVYEQNGVLNVVYPENNNIWTCQAPTPTFNNDMSFGLGGSAKLGPSNSIGLKFSHDFMYTMFPQTVILNQNIHAPDTSVQKVPTDAQLITRGYDIDDPSHVRSFLELHARSDEHALKMGTNYHNVINQREWLIEWKLAGPDLLAANVIDMIYVSDGSARGSYLEGIYGIVSIEMDISFDRGFTQTIKGCYGRTEGEDAQY